MKKSLLFISFCMSVHLLMAQHESMLSDGVSDYIRRSQLTGELNRSNSLLINSFAQNLAHFDSLQKNKPLVLAKTKNNFLRATFLLVGLPAWLRFTLIFGFEKPNPYAAIRNQPSFSLTNFVAAV